MQRKASAPEVVNSLHLRRGSCSVAIGQQERKMADLSLHDPIEEELAFDPSIDAADIGVAVQNGIVTSTGHARSNTEKIAAERAVKILIGRSPDFWRADKLPVEGITGQMARRISGSQSLERPIITTE